MKHLKIAVIISPVTCAFQIQDQTHRESDFGPDGTTQFRASNGITISSCHSPDFDSNCDILFVRGADVSKDARVVVVDSPQNIKRISDAVREYNATFSDTKGEDENTYVEIIG